MLDADSNRDHWAGRRGEINSDRECSVLSFDEVHMVQGRGKIASMSSRLVLQACTGEQRCQASRLTQPPEFQLSS